MVNFEFTFTYSNVSYLFISLFRFGTPVAKEVSMSFLHRSISNCNKLIVMSTSCTMTKIYDHNLVLKAIKAKMQTIYILPYNVPCKGQTKRSVVYGTRIQPYIHFLQISTANLQRNSIIRLI